MANPSHLVLAVHSVLVFLHELSIGQANSCLRDSSHINVIVDSNLQVIEQVTNRLPELPDGTPTISYGHVSDCDRFHCEIVLGAPMSMGPADSYYAYSRQMRRSAQLFLDWINDERGGVRVNDTHVCSVRFYWVDDSSSKQQVTNATAHALRDSGANFAFAGYSSGLTAYATKQSFADGKVMVATSAASASAFTNELTFGTMLDAGQYLVSAINAVRNAAMVADSRQQAQSLCGESSCEMSLKFGFIQADAVFTKSSCESLPDLVQSMGFYGTPAIATVRKSPSVSEVMSQLQILKDAGVNVIAGCTYYSTGIAIISALERMDYAPRALMLTSTVASPLYVDKIQEGWWQGEYALGVSPWHETVPQRGEFSGWTSAEFAKRYRERYNSEVAYQGASMFAGLCSLAHAIEDAESLDTQEVATALRELQLSEFYGDIGFASNGQNNRMQTLVLQYAPGNTSEEVVYPAEVVTTGKLRFPMPSWAQRRCRAIGPGKTWQDSLETGLETIVGECSNHGLCNEDGLCVCDENWDGDTCDHRTTETGLSGGVVAAIIIGVSVVLIGCGCLSYFWKNRQVKALKREMQELKETVVGMRSVVHDFYPTGGVPRLSKRHDPEVFIWYWAEDPSRMSAHNRNLTYPPNWVQYCGSVAGELEGVYQEYKNGKRPGMYDTDLTDRIASTGTEAKAFAADSGTKYTIDFVNMKQINARTGYARNILRRLVPPLPSHDSVVPTAVGGDTLDPESKVAPRELAGETLLMLKVGSVVQVSKQLANGWAFGNVVYNIDEDSPDDASTDFMSMGSSGSVTISQDAGWFPLACTSLPTKEALTKLQKTLGSGGVDSLAPPPEWLPLKDPMVAERFLVPDGEEKNKLVIHFMQTLKPDVKVVRVERIQNLSLWQSFAVKRQTMLQREGDSKDLEKRWLFHGTYEDTVPKISEQGFNRAFCGKHATMYGKGVYFARDASYSAGYSAPDGKGLRYMFACRVMVGAYCQGIKDAPAPGVRDASRHLLFDSTVNTMTQPSIFVAYHDAQAYPEYLIHFTQPS